MAYLEIGGRRHAILVGELAIGSDAAAQLLLSDTGVHGGHAIVQGLADGQVAIRLGEEPTQVLVNGVRLGRQPVPLLHGDKVEIAGHELLFVDERRSGSTQYVQAVDPALMDTAKPAGLRAATAGTGGRLVSLTDGREYSIGGGSVLIGRDAGCDVVVMSKSVSRRHAEVMASPRGYVLIDSSTNGSFVNGNRVQGQQVLARGDVIRCGDYEFRFNADVAVAPDMAPPLSAEPAAPAPPPGATPPPGAEHRLSHTLHGMPAVPKPAGMPRGRPARPFVPREPAPPPPEAAAPPPTPPTPEPPLEPKAPAPQPRVAKEQPVAGMTVLANLVVRSGGLKGQRFPIKVPIVNVGRAEYNDIVLPDDSVSTTHAKLQRREGIWVLVDLESTNGTMVDGERVSGEVPLAPGALIRFGEIRTIFEPTDDTIDAQKGSSTRLIDAIRLPEKPTDDRGGAQ
jgi:pSer/pThr/pTyr-binding forkhead associated (FHA) protein